MDFDDIKDMFKALIPDKKEFYVYIRCNSSGLETSVSKNLSTINEAHKRQLSAFLASAKKQIEAHAIGKNNKLYIYAKEGKYGLETSISKDSGNKHQVPLLLSYELQIISFIEGINETLK